MRNKLKRFSDNDNNPYIIQPGKDIYEDIKGNWSSLYFKNSNPICLELGCGQGVYTTSLAERFRDKNFIGIDIKGSRMWVGANHAYNNNLNNVAFLRTQIELIENFFVEGEVEDIYITFPDPRPKKSDIKRRLTSPRFLDLYDKIKISEGRIHLKTDSIGLFNYTLEVLEERKVNLLNKYYDLYSYEGESIHKEIQTPYEKRFIRDGVSIKYLCF